MLHEPIKIILYRLRVHVHMHMRTSMHGARLCGEIECQHGHVLVECEG